MKPEQDANSSLDERSWDELAALYRGGETSTGGAPEQPALGRPRRTLGALLRDALGLALGLACVVAALLGGASPLIVVVGGGAGLLWLWLTITSWGRRRARVLARSLDTARYVHAETDRLAQEELGWRLGTIVFALLAALSLLLVPLSFNAVRPPGVETPQHLLWAALTGWLALLAGISRWRARAADRARAAHDELVEALELPLPSDLVGVPARRVQIIAIAALLAIASASLLYTKLGPTNLADDPARVLIISDDADEDYVGFLRQFGLDGEQLTTAAVLARSRGSSGETAPLFDALQLADQLGYGFVAIDLGELGERDPARQRWFELEARDFDKVRSVRAFTTGDRFATISVGDMAPYRSQLAFGRPHPWMDEDPRARARLSLLRALVFQPGFGVSDFGDDYYPSAELLETRVRDRLPPALFRTLVGPALAIEGELDKKRTPAILID